MSKQFWNKCDKCGKPVFEACTCYNEIKISRKVAIPQVVAFEKKCAICFMSKKGCNYGKCSTCKQFANGEHCFTREQLVNFEECRTCVDIDACCVCKHFQSYKQYVNGEMSVKDVELACVSTVDNTKTYAIPKCGINRIRIFGKVEKVYIQDEKGAVIWKDVRKSFSQFTIEMGFVNFGYLSNMMLKVCSDDSVKVIASVNGTRIDAGNSLHKSISQCL